MVIAPGFNPLPMWNRGYLPARYSYEPSADGAKCMLSLRFVTEQCPHSVAPSSCRFELPRLNWSSAKLDLALENVADQF